MEQQTRNDASWRQRNQMHIQHHLQRQQNATTPKPALLMEFSKTAEEITKWKKGETRNADTRNADTSRQNSVVAAHFNIDGNRQSINVPLKVEQTASWCSGSWMSRYGQDEHFTVKTSSGLSSITVQSPGIYYVYAQVNPEAGGLLLQRNGRRQAWCRATPGSTCFTASVVALDAGDNVAVRDIDGKLLNNSSASMGFIRLNCPKSG